MIEETPIYILNRRMAYLIQLECKYVVCYLKKRRVSEE